MINTFSLEQVSRTANLDANLVFRQHEPDLMVQFLEIKSFNPKRKQKELAKQLIWSTSTLQRYRYDIKMQSPSKSEILKRHQKTWNDLKKPQKESLTDVDSTITRSMT